MAITILSCYFLPFLLFFCAQIAFPKSLLACVLGISSLSISSLVLYLKALELKTAKKEAAPQAKAKITRIETSPIVATALNTLIVPTKYTYPNYKATIEEQKNAILSQKNLFEEELANRTAAIRDLKTALEAAKAELAAKEADALKQAKELEDLKFELYTLLRIESHGKLATASF